MSNEMITQLTEKYRNPPYQLPVAKARELALKEAISRRKAAQREAKKSSRPYGPWN